MKPFLILFAGSLLVTGTSFAEELSFLKPTTEYSGTRLIETSEGDMKQQVYWTEDKVRTETDIGGMAVTNIVREDLGVMWVLNSMIGQCIEQTIESAEAQTQLGNGSLGGDSVEYEELGQEEIDGRVTTKYRVNASDPDGSTYESLMWVTAENILVRMEVEPDADSSAGHFVMSLTDLELGPQPASLFESPGDCMKMPQTIGPQMP